MARLIKGMVVAPAQVGHWARFSRSFIERSRAKTDWQSAHRYSYSGITSSLPPRPILVWWLVDRRTSVRYDPPMSRRPTEMELPLGDGAGGDLARRRFEHLAQVAGVDRTGLIRLSRAFASLGGVYIASEKDLARVVGDVAAARIRWFLDGPLSSSVIDPTAAPVIARAA